MRKKNPQDFSNILINLLKEVTYSVSNVSRSLRDMFNQDANGMDIVKNILNTYIKYSKMKLCTFYEIKISYGLMVKSMKKKKKEKKSFR